MLSKQRGKDLPKAVLLLRKFPPSLRKAPRVWAGLLGCHGGTPTPGHSGYSSPSGSSPSSHQHPQWSGHLQEELLG